MTKKIMSLVLLAVMLVCSVSVLFSCGGDETEGVKYTVTVLDDKGAPATGVQLSVRNTDTNKKKLITTDNSGVAVYELEAAASLEVTVFDAKGYTFDASKVYTFTDNTLSITLEKEAEAEKETYIVYVKDASGNAVAGESVHICKASDDGLCTSPVTTDADGKAVFEVEAGSKWKAKFVSGTEYTYFEDGSNEVTLIKQ